MTMRLAVPIRRLLNCIGGPMLLSRVSRVLFLFSPSVILILQGQLRTALSARVSVFPTGFFLGKQYLPRRSTENERPSNARQSQGT